MPDTKSINVRFLNSYIFKLSEFPTTFVVLGSVATDMKERQSTVGKVVRQTTVAAAVEKCGWLRGGTEHGCGTEVGSTTAELER